MLSQCQTLWRWRLLNLNVMISRYHIVFVIDPCLVHSPLEPIPIIRNASQINVLVPNVVHFVIVELVIASHVKIVFESDVWTLNFSLLDEVLPATALPMGLRHERIHPK